MKKITIIIAAILALMGCSKESALQLNTEDVVMYSLDEHFITSNGTNVSFSSENPYIASVNETTGKVKGMHIGETYINVVADEGSAKVKITIKAKYHTITDPYLDWNANQHEIENKCGFADEINDGNLYYFYGNENYGDKHIGTVYSLKNDRLQNVMVIINNEYFDETALHLAERFQYIGYEDGVYVYMDAMKEEDVKTIISLFKTSGRWIVMYTPHK